MKLQLKCLVLILATLLATTSNAQDRSKSGHADEALKLAAIEALMMAPPDKALPVLAGVVSGSGSIELKSRALFVLSQIDDEEANAIVLQAASSAGGDLQTEAIRMIGIGGREDSIAKLAGIYQSSDKAAREAVLEAYMIADEPEAIYQIASNAQSDEEFEKAVHMLGVMGATDFIKRLESRPGATSSLVFSYAMAGDTETLLRIAGDSSNPEAQLAAINGLGIVGGAQVNETLRELYRTANDEEVREAVLKAMLISGDDMGVIELFKAATSNEEKARLLKMLVIMDSDGAMEAIDAALGGDGQ